jgi:hypothetical protein
MNEIRLKTFVTLTHANLKVPVAFFPNKAFYLYTSPTHGCVHIISDAGTICPVSETEEQILRIISQSPKKDEVTNGTAKEDA